VPFSCFVLPNSFLAVPWTSGPVFMFCAPGLVFGSAEGDRSRFFCFALPDSFLAVPRASGLVFMFGAPEPVCGGTKGAESSFYVLRSRTRLPPYRWRQVNFSCFSLSDPFSVILRAPSPVFMFYALASFYAVSKARGLVFMLCAPRSFSAVPRWWSSLHVLRSQTRFRFFN
jgi:hypothetical protein